MDEEKLSIFNLLFFSRRGILFNLIWALIRKTWLAGGCKNGTCQNRLWPREREGDVSVNDQFMDSTDLGH
jgi:hypothetical protein